MIVACAVLGAHAAIAQQSGMSFRLAQLPAAACGAQCPEVVVAEGVIEPGTPSSFVAFARSSISGHHLRAVVLIDSPGGNVLASMQLGTIFRRLKMAAIVARVDRSGLGEPLAARCISACVYAIMGATKRVVPGASQVGLHRMSIVEYQNASRSVPRVTRSFAASPMVDALSRYARGMGVSTDLVQTAEALRADEVHLVSPAEMKRWRFATSRF